MLKKFTVDGKTFFPKQDLGDFQQWECGGDLFTVPNKSPTRQEIKEEYDRLCDNDERYG